MPGPDDIDRWIAALMERHAAPLRRPEFLKAIRALSARYVERRGSLPDRSPIDSAGKRAAFAAYYAPKHFLTVREIVRALDRRSSAIQGIIDLGCGTGAAGAAWAHALDRRPRVRGVDRSRWATGEARWTYRTFHLTAEVSPGDLVRAAGALVRLTTSGLFDRTAVVLAWSANEITAADRRQLLSSLIDVARRGAAVLIVEPVSQRAAPWFDDWAQAIVTEGGRHDEWRFDQPRSPLLAALDEETGLGRGGLIARSLAINLT
jgi:hypothetical protein